MRPGEPASDAPPLAGLSVVPDQLQRIRMPLPIGKKPQHCIKIIAYHSHLRLFSGANFA
ncbi:hypothetical protein [Achromobacter denitrificans]|uniref:hypothetical protein n=1 Tax=Achromobacter denitrificans TaxID=32002 RepID=UPI00166AA9AF|nr:hypothetical protein [Achromobacter denitrificans]